MNSERIWVFVSTTTRRRLDIKIINNPNTEVICTLKNLLIHSSYSKQFSNLEEAKQYKAELETLILIGAIE